MRVTGQTGRQLKTRIVVHKNHILWSTTTHSFITEHRLQEGHEFDWKNIVILDKEPQYRKKLFSEMLYIRKQMVSICKWIWRGFAGLTFRLLMSYKCRSCWIASQCRSFIELRSFYLKIFELLFDFLSDYNQY